MCFKTLKGNLDKSEGDDISAKYKIWFEHQSSCQLEMKNFNKTFPDYGCNFFFLTADNQY